MALDYGHIVRITQNGMVDPSTWHNSQWQRKEWNTTTWENAGVLNDATYTVVDADQGGHIRLKQIFGSNKQELYSNELEVTSANPPPPPKTAEVFGMGTDAGTICYGQGWGTRTGGTVITFPKKLTQTFEYTFATKEEELAGEKNGWVKHAGNFSGSSSNKYSDCVWWEEGSVALGVGSKSSWHDPIAGRWGTLVDFAGSAAFVDDANHQAILFSPYTPTPLKVTELKQNWKNDRNDYEQHDVTWEDITMSQGEKKHLSNYIMTNDRKIIWQRGDYFNHYDIDSRLITKHEPVGPAVWGQYAARLSYSPYDGCIYMFSSSKRYVSVYDPRTGSLFERDDWGLTNIYQPNSFGGIVLHPDGKTWFLPRCSTSGTGPCKVAFQDLNGSSFGMFSADGVKSSDNLYFNKGVVTDRGDVYSPVQSPPTTNKQFMLKIKTQSYAEKWKWKWEPSDPIANNA